MITTYQNIPGEMMDFEKFYTTISLSLPDYPNIAEIGNADGRSMIFMSEQLSFLHKPVNRFVAIDNCVYGQTEQRNTIIKNIIRSGANIEFMESGSLDASTKFPDNYFDFIFIDSAHTYEMTKAEIRLWYRKLKDGGIMGLHDYLEHAEVSQAVDEVVPETVIRESIEGQTFLPEKVLMVEQTDKGYGIAWFEKKWYLKMR